MKYFQRRNGLSADGIVGSATAAALGITLSGASGSSSGSSGGSVTSSDLNLLARVVYGEARGEAYVGQVAVAAVVLNRVESASFPNTIAGVVYQSGAFDCVADGQINLTPDSTAVKAAQDALNGWDPHLRVSVLLQSRDGDVRMDAFPSRQAGDRESQFLLGGAYETEG